MLAEGLLGFGLWRGYGFSRWRGCSRWSRRGWARRRCLCRRCSRWGCGCLRRDCRLWRRNCWWQGCKYINYYEILFIRFLKHFFLHYNRMQLRKLCIQFVEFEEDLLHIGGLQLLAAGGLRHLAEGLLGFGLWQSYGCSRWRGCSRWCRRRWSHRRCLCCHCSRWGCGCLRRSCRAWRRNRG